MTSILCGLGCRKNGDVERQTSRGGKVDASLARDRSQASVEVSSSAGVVKLCQRAQNF